MSDENGKLDINHMTAQVMDGIDCLQNQRKTPTGMTMKSMMMRIITSMITKLITSSFSISLIGPQVTRMMMMTWTMIRKIHQSAELAEELAKRGPYSSIDQLLTVKIEDVPQFRQSLTIADLQRLRPYLRLMATPLEDKLNSDNISISNGLVDMGTVIHQYEFQPNNGNRRIRTIYD